MSKKDARKSSKDSILETGYGGNSGIEFSRIHFERKWDSYLFSPNSGILPFNPILLLALFQWPRFRCAHIRYALLIFSICFTWFCLMTSFSHAYGWGWGNRYLLPLIPLILIPILLFPPSKKRTRALNPPVLTVAMIQIASVSIKIHEYFTLLIQAPQEYNATNTSDQLSSTIRLFAYKTQSTDPHYHLSIVGGPNKIRINMSVNYWRGSRNDALGG